MNFIAMILSLSLGSAASTAKISSCRSLFTKSPNQTFGARLNLRFRRTYSLKERLGFGPELRFRLFRPFVISSFDEFFPHGQLPPVTTTNRLLVKRLSREDGIREIRRGLRFDEERGWIFIPSEELWIYDSVDYANITTVGSNSLLRKLLGEEFGEIESFHTHPIATMKHLFEMYHGGRDDRPDYDRFKISGAMPSPDDLMQLTRTIDLGAKESLSRMIGHVVHEFGVTSYRMRAFPYHDGTRDTGIYPGLAGWSDAEAAKLDHLPPHQLIVRMARRAEQRSTESVDCMIDVCKWTPATAPRLILDFKPW